MFSLQKNSNRHVTVLERDMLSYQASLEIQDCRLTDAGVYRVELHNREGIAKAKASLVVTEKSAVENLDVLPSVFYCPGLESLKNYHSETDLRKTGIRIAQEFENTPSECGSAPGGTITHRRPFSPRQYYERRNKENRSPQPPDATSTIEVTSKSGRESRISKCSDFEQSFSSISSMSSSSIASPSRLSRSFDNDDRSISFSDSLSRSLTTADQRKLNSLRSAGADNGLLVGLFKARSNQTLTDIESTGMRAFDEQSTISSFSGIRSQYGDQNVVEIDAPRKIVRPKRIPPVIITPLPKDIIELKVGDELKLFCVVDGSPSPKVVWMKDAENLSNIPEYSFEHVNLNMLGDRGWRSLLTVASVTSQHSGTYALTAYNLQGDVSTETRVIVREAKGK